jgi:hypothetical protein
VQWESECSAVGGLIYASQVILLLFGSEVDGLPHDGEIYPLLERSAYIGRLLLDRMPDMGLEVGISSAPMEVRVMNRHSGLEYSNSARSGKPVIAED